MHSHTLTISSQHVTLLPQRAAYWHERGTLLLADLHLGKVETFAAHGVPLPDVMTRQLAMLSDAIEATAPTRVLVLGDLLHAPAGLTEPMLEAVHVWREQHDCEFAVVPGNHDRHLEKVARWWGMRELPARHDEGPFTFMHEPAPAAGRFVFAGHVHPVVKLRSRSDTLKLWCFVLDTSDFATGVCTLPAFCDFTSGGTVDIRQRHRHVYAIAEECVITITPPAPATPATPRPATSSA
jgi:hypothetical protein